MTRRGSRVRSGGGGVLCGVRRRRRRRVRFGEWARRLAGRLAAALVLAAVAPAFVVPLGAQALPGNEIMTCVENAPETAAFRSGGDLAPDGEAREGGFIPPTSMMRAAVGCAETFANTTMVPIGLNLLRYLAIIITIWTGIQMMFGGGFAIGEVVSLLLLIGFPFAVLSYYAATVATPWGDMSFTRMVSGMGETIASELVDEVFKTINETFSDTWDTIWATAVARDTFEASEREGWWGRFVRGFSTVDFGLGASLGDVVNFVRNTLQTIQFIVLVVVVFLLLAIPALVAYCSYLWGYLSLLVAVILGPLLIPWILVPQLQFLAWGWFRTVLGAGIHMMVAGACFAVAAQILLIPLVRFGTQVAAQRDAGFLSWNTLMSAAGPHVVIVESLPLIVVAYLGVFKIGEITSMIMNGGSMPSSGIGDRVRSLQSSRMGRALAGRALGGGAGAAVAGTAGRLAAGATGVGAVVLAGRAVLSQATKGNK